MAERGKDGGPGLCGGSGPRDQGGARDPKAELKNSKAEAVELKTTKVELKVQETTSVEQTDKTTTVEQKTTASYKHREYWTGRKFIDGLLGHDRAG